MLCFMSFSRQGSLLGGVYRALCSGRTALW
nr:MAG TPA: hypothetical protein [Caudoviricetes sp.]